MLRDSRADPRMIDPIQSSSSPRFNEQGLRCRAEDYPGTLKKLGGPPGMHMVMPGN